MPTQDMLNCFNVNVIGQVHLFNVYLPLIRNGSVKKVILIGAGHADISVMTQYKIFEAGPYTISKAAANAVVGKYAAELQDEGILFLSICPGPVDTTPPIRMSFPSVLATLVLS
jgi:NAD(P)-dependent dehydrogenase (short-subunit alcohol dehydrogenase family)